MPGPTFLSGDRVALRTVEREDLEFVQKHRNDPELRRPLTLDVPSNGEQQESFFEDVVSDGDTVNLLICRDGERIGTISLFDIGAFDGGAEIAIWLAPDAQGEGYGTEAAELLVDYAFRERRLHRITARVLATNAASMAVWEKLGFSEEGVFRDATFTGGEYVDNHYYGVLATEWEGAQ